MSRISFKARNNKITKFSPTRVIVLSFAILILIGGLLLTLPIASNNGKSIGFLNALFTATSATCVTGLVIADTLTQWTLFGQLVILFLIQIGGLGIVTLATFFSVAFGKKLSVKSRILAQESLNHFSYDEALRLIRYVIRITFGIEFLGAFILSTRFVPKFGPKGFYLGIFHAVSAFCNAGFDIMGGYKNLSDFHNDPVVLYTIAFLIIFGGLGFIVWKDLFDYRKHRFFYLQTKVVLITTASLIIVGTLFFFISEYGNQMTLGSFNFVEKINNAFFHSVSCRTAGFNSVSLNDMSEISKIMTVFLMFIGAAPGSTGGGVKVTTFSVILMAIICNIRGDSETTILKRRVPHYIVDKALAIVGLSGILVLVMTTIIVGVEHKSFVNVLYEATSAFGTVGLSTGITSGLHAISKSLLILTMFLGRVGPLSFAVALTIRGNRKGENIIYPEGKIVVG
jgi:trk system potassium uptake protein